MKSLIKLIQSDNEHWKVELGKSRINFFLLFLLLREYRIVVLFRIVQYLRKNRIFVILYFFMRFLYRCYTLKNGCEIPSSTKIGGGLVIHHCNGIVINSETKIGNNLVIRSGCVIGNEKGCPEIGDNVVMGVHSVVIGNIKIRDNCVIGAGAVLTKSTEPNGIYAGVPAKRIKDRV